MAGGYSFMEWCMRRLSRAGAAIGMVVLLYGFGLIVGCDDDDDGDDNEDEIAEGRDIFRHDTFGNEHWWTDTLRMHEVIETAVSPIVALGVGLKVDSDQIPKGVLDTANLNSPATTVELLKLDAVVGLEAQISASNKIERVGITCALCHSTVDNSVMAGIGSRLDGWINPELDPGKIVALSPYFDDKPQVRAALNGWGPRMYDAYFNHDGVNDPVVTPPAYGLADVELETYSGEGPVSYWNAYVAVTQMHGQGSFSDSRLGIDITASPDLVTPKLPALLAYQLSLEKPAPPPGSFNEAAAARGDTLFRGTARCATCHIPPTFTDVSTTLHLPEETGMDAVRAQRGTTGRYRTTPLRALWQHPPYFHDGSAATLADVVDHYDQVLSLGLSVEQKADLVAYLMSL